MAVTVIDARTDPRWRDLISSRPSEVFHSPEWMDVLAVTYGFEPKAAVLEGADGPVAGVAFCVIDDLRGRRTVSLPFSDFCDPIVDDAASWSTLADTLEGFTPVTRMRVVHSSLPVDDDRFTTIGTAAWHGIDLGSDTDALWAGLNSSARRAVRKARKEGVKARPATDRDELRAFFDLHLRTRKHKYGLLAQPYAFFEAIWDRFVEHDRGRLMVSEHDGEIIGGIFLLDWQDTTYYKFNASDPRYVDLRPNDLALWTAIEDASERGFAQLDFGLSDIDQEGLLRYKRKYATEEKEITSLERRTEDKTEAQRGAEASLGALTRMLTDESVPDEITERAGDELYRYFV